MLRRFLKAPSGLLGLGLVSLILVVSILGPKMLGAYASVIDVNVSRQNPTWHHLLGTDALGRDILSRLIVATRLSISLGLAAAALGALIGIPFGSMAASLNPRPRSVVLRLLDVLLAFPALLVAIFVAAIVGPGILGALIGIGIPISFQFARITSALTLSVRGREYISAARVIGVSRLRVVYRYVLPNIAESLTILSTLYIGSSIVDMSSLSFLGLGVQPPAFDWGRMLTEGVQAIYLTPIAAVGPAIALAISSLAFGFVGEALARAMNPVISTRKPSETGHKSDPVPDSGTAAESGGAVRHDQVPMDRDLLTVSHLTISFPGPDGPQIAVDDVSFSIAKDEVVAIVGESGSGKTLTAMAIARLVPYPGSIKGTIRFHGHDLEAVTERALNRLLGTDLAVIFQDPLSSLNPVLRIGTQLIEGPVVHRGLNRGDAAKLAAIRLREVNMPTPEQQLKRYPHEFSGGMRQRVMIAMGLMNEITLLIADEPTTALDVTIQAQIMNLLEGIHASRKIAMLFISHNLALVTRNCSRIIVMYAGRVVEELTKSELLTSPLHPYTKALLSAVPDVARPRDLALANIAGNPPDPAQLPSGCPFHPRCPLAVSKCIALRPPLLPTKSGRLVACWVAHDQTNNGSSKGVDTPMDDKPSL